MISATTWELALASYYDGADEVVTSQWVENHHGTLRNILK